MPARLVPYVYVLPAAAIMGVGLFWPVVEVLGLSLVELRLGDAPGAGAWRGLSLFLEALSDTSARSSMLVTLGFAALAVTIEMTLGVALALLLERPVRGMAALRTVFVLPMMIAPICVGLIWRYLFDTSYGWVNALLRPFGLEQAWLADPGLAFLAMVLTDVWQFTPFVFIMVLAGLQGLDRSLMEAAEIDGARGWQVILRVKLPLLAPILMITLLLRLIDALRGLEVIFVMTFGGPGLATELFSLHIYKAAFIGQRLGYAAALSVVLLVVVSALSMALLLLSNPMRQARS
jgi:multiple sugar transport system permease protein